MLERDAYGPKQVAIRVWSLGVCMLVWAGTATAQDNPHRDLLASGGYGPLMIAVETGTFSMGCVSGVACRLNTPVHEVTIEQPFELSVYEVTRGEFRTFVERTDYRTSGELNGGRRLSTMGCAGISLTQYRRHSDPYTRPSASARTWRAPGFPQTDDHPVVCLTWDDAVAYTEWLAAETGKPYRLPSEAEWEYAARANRHWVIDSSTICDPHAFEDVSNCAGAPYTEPVGHEGPNAFGLYDMLRNAHEWVLDCWHEDFRGAPDNGSAWLSGDCDLRVVRVGGWGRLVVQHEGRGPGRTGHHSTNQVGFRVAQSPTH